MLVTWIMLKVHVYKHVNVCERMYVCYFGLLHTCLGLKKAMKLLFLPHIASSVIELP